MKNFILSDTEIHVFKINLTVPLNRDSDSLLDLHERSRAQQFKSDLQRQKYINAHTGLRKILTHYLKTNPLILNHAHGKPYLKDFPELCFSLSHSENLALCALTLHLPIGIDIEYIHRHKRDVKAIAKRFFSIEEYQKIRVSDHPEKLFLTLWTQKEAYLKAIGKGLSHGLTNTVPDHYKIYDFQPAPDYTASLVIINHPSKKLILSEM